MRTPSSEEPQPDSINAHKPTPTATRPQRTDIAMPP